MTQNAHTMTAKRSGMAIIRASLAIGVAGILPLLLYAAFGPKNGNPIGLGLLAMVAVPVATIGTAAGLLKLVIEFVARKSR